MAEREHVSANVAAAPSFQFVGEGRVVARVLWEQKPAPKIGKIFREIASLSKFYRKLYEETKPRALRLNGAIERARVRHLLRL